MSFQEWLRDAKVELEDLRRIPGNSRASDAERAAYGQKAALMYLANSDIVMLEAAGPVKLGALLAAVGQEYFNLDSAGSALLQQAAVGHGEDGGEVPQVALLAMHSCIQARGPVSDFLVPCETAFPELALRILAIAAHLMQSDGLRRHLAKAQRTTAPGIGPVTSAPAPAQSASVSPQQTALAIREAEAKALVHTVAPAEAARALLALAPPQRALALASAFTGAVDSASPQEADDVREHLGRRIEGVLDEMPEDEGNATLRAMISSGDVETVLSAVRGRAGEVSSTAERLTVPLISELFERDPDMHSDRRADRATTLGYTLLCETREDHPAVNAFFNSPEGQALLRLILQSSRSGDEDALEILHTAERRGIAVPVSVEARDEDEDDQRRDPDAEVEGEDFEPPPEPDEEEPEDENDRE